MSKFKLQFKLKQHTPIIHFQYDQYGATLRASELKPKLDKFLIDKFTKENINYSDWLIKGQEKALNYKVTINTGGIKINRSVIGTERRDGYPTYFANMGAEYKDKPNGSSFAKEIVTIDITCFSKLIDEIKKYFPNFLAVTNFGTRQSKGFGSFFLESEYIQGYPYLSINQRSSFKDVFNVINYYYQRLKSGINYDYTNIKANKTFKHYQHSFLKIYLTKNEINPKSKIDYVWEKRWMKEHFIGLKSNEKKERYARMMLGLVDGYTFKPKNSNKREGEVYPKYEINIDVKSKEIERFKSPIMFKPIKDNNEWRIYIITSKLPDNIRNKEFTFSVNNKEKSIKTPNDLIDLDDLINEYHKELTTNFEAFTFVGKSYKVTIKN